MQACCTVLPATPMIGSYRTCLVLRTNLLDAKLCRRGFPVLETSCIVVFEQSHGHEHLRDISLRGRTWTFHLDERRGAHVGLDIEDCDLKVGSGVQLWFLLRERVPLPASRVNQRHVVYPRLLIIPIGYDLTIGGRPWAAKCIVGLLRVRSPSTSS